MVLPKKAIIISHKENLDDLVSAGLLYAWLREDNKKRKDIELYLVDYISINQILSMFIDFHQKNYSKLIENVMKMQTRKKWNKYFDSEICNSSAVKTWKRCQYIQVIANLVFIKEGSVKMVISTADYRAENIVYFLKIYICDAHIYRVLMYSAQIL